jgi:anti-sigma-K factor RskA
VVVAFDAKSGALLVTPGPGLRARGHTPHLWLVSPDGGVQLVGAIDATRAATHNLPRALSRRADAARGLALSLEPAGHNPIEAPGGPVVARGDFTEL